MIRRVAQDDREGLRWAGELVVLAVASGAYDLLIVARNALVFALALASFVESVFLGLILVIGLNLAFGEKPLFDESESPVTMTLVVPAIVLLFVTIRAVRNIREWTPQPPMLPGRGRESPLWDREVDGPAPGDFLWR